MGREIGRQPKLRLRECRASMRPGPIGPGNGPSGRRIRRKRRCFNEARPNWAGKYPDFFRDFGDFSAGFNEARPNWAGKLAARQHEVRTRLLASMRPGPIGPGNSLIRRLIAVRLGCFNEARPNWAGKCRRRRGTRGPPPRFNEARPNWAGKWKEPAPGRKYPPLASMRPGPIGPGNLDARVLQMGQPVRFNEARPNWAGK